jgi:hypothetical protein
MSILPEAENKLFNVLFECFVNCPPTELSLHQFCPNYTMI